MSMLQHKSLLTSNGHYVWSSENASQTLSPVFKQKFKTDCTRKAKTPCPDGCPIICMHSELHGHHFYLLNTNFLIHITDYANIFHFILYKNSSLLSITIQTFQDEIHTQKTSKLKKH